MSKPLKDDLDEAIEATYSSTLRDLSKLALEDPFLKECTFSFRQDLPITKKGMPLTSAYKMIQYSDAFAEVVKELAELYSEEDLHAAMGYADLTLGLRRAEDFPEKEEPVVETSRYCYICESFTTWFISETKDTCVSCGRDQ